MSFEITGKLIAKYDTQVVSDKFKKREFVLELAEEINGNIYTNYAKMQLVQAKCEIIDRYNTGEVVKVSFNVKGNSYVDKKDGITKYISNLDAWRVEAPSAAGNAPAQGQPAQVYNQAPQAYSQGQQGFNQSQQGYNQGQQGYNQAPPNNAPNFNQSSEAIDDLPF